MPKQFIPILNDKSTFQETLLRVSRNDIFEKPVIVTSDKFRFLCRHQCAEISIHPKILIESDQRNSAPAIAAATSYIQRENPQALILVLPSDHIIRDVDRFTHTCKGAIQAARQGAIVTIGIKPTAPNTEYGYILPGNEIAPEAFSVRAFIEKPSADQASHYISNSYLWNSGNFLFRADVFMAELDWLEPDISNAARLSVVNSSADLGFTRLHYESFSSVSNISIDYAVMEKTNLAAVVKGNFDWQDIGSWNGLYQSLDKDSDGNAVIGNAHLENTANSMIVNQGHFIVGNNLKDMLVVATEKVLLISPRIQSSDIAALATRAQQEITSPKYSRVYRPWGYSEDLDHGDKFKVKRLVVWPGEKLSLQKHEHRSEHWIVVRGVAEVTVDDKIWQLKAGQSIDVPLSISHRLSNTTDEIIELIEVQTGDYIDENDIIRIDDIYDRI